MKSLSLLLALLLIGCSKDSPTEPPAPTPVMTGSWNVQLTGSSSTVYGSMTLTQIGGKVAGMYNPASNIIPITLSGTISDMGMLLCDGTDGTQYRYVLDATVSAGRDSFKGALRCYQGTVLSGTYIVSGQKSSSKVTVTFGGKPLALFP
jgi:hypothetical protein